MTAIYFTANAVYIERSCLLLRISTSEQFRAQYTVIHCVSKNDATQPSTIILTVVVRFQQFWYKYSSENMPSKGGLIGLIQ